MSDGNEDVGIFYIGNKRRVDFLENLIKSLSNADGDARIVKIHPFIKEIDNSHGDLRPMVIGFMHALSEIMASGDLDRRTNHRFLTMIVAFMAGIIDTDPFIPDPIEHLEVVLKDMGFDEKERGMFNEAHKLTKDMMKDYEQKRPD